MEEQHRVRAGVIEKLAYSSQMTEVERAKWLGRLEQLDEVIRWLDFKLKRGKITRLPTPEVMVPGAIPS